MSGKQNTRLKRRCKKVWRGLVDLRMVYGTQGFEKFLEHAKTDMKKGNQVALDRLEEQLKKQEAGLVDDNEAF